MRTKIIEATIDSLWLKVIVAVLDESEIARPSAVPYNVENYPGRPLLQLERATKPDDIWIMDLSTGEGMALSAGTEPTWQMLKVSAKL